MKKILTGAALALVFAASATVSAQQTEPQDGQERPGRHHGMKRMGGHGRHGFGAFGQLNLTDAQKEQLRALHESHRLATQAQREELRQIFQTRRQGGQLTTEQEARARQIHEELRASHESLRAQMLNVLTPEQRTQLEQLKQERKARMEQRRLRRQQMREQNDQQ